MVGRKVGWAFVCIRTWRPVSTLYWLAATLCLRSPRKRPKASTSTRFAAPIAMKTTIWRSRRSHRICMAIFDRKTLPSGVPATDAAVQQNVLAGKGMMPGFAGRFTDEQMAALLAYLHTGLR